jgi:hypothetical protein
VSGALSAPAAINERNDSRHGNARCTDFGWRFNINTAECSDERNYGHPRRKALFGEVLGLNDSAVSRCFRARQKLSSHKSRGLISIAVIFQFHHWMNLARSVAGKIASPALDRD